VPYGQPDQTTMDIPCWNARLPALCPAMRAVPSRRRQRLVLLSFAVPLVFFLIHARGFGQQTRHDLPPPLFFFPQLLIAQRPMRARVSPNFFHTHGHVGQLRQPRTLA